MRSTSSRESSESATSTSVLCLVSAIGFGVNSWKRFSTSSMAKLSSPMIMQVTFSSVKRGSKR
jgi:hypothetical protein